MHPEPHAYALGLARDMPHPYIRAPLVAPGDAGPPECAAIPTGAWDSGAEHRHRRHRRDRYQRPMKSSMRRPAGRR